MRKFHRSALLAGASALALGLGMTQANAFNSVSWDWSTWLKECVDINVNVNIDPNPGVIDQIEKLQISIGDKTANAYVDSVTNDPATTYHIEQLNSSFSGSFKGQMAFGGKIFDEKIAELQPEQQKGGFPSFIGGNKTPDYVPVYKPDTDPFYGHGYLWGGFSGSSVSDVLVADPINALTDLPLVQISAVALGNSESVTSNVALALHEGQFSFNVDPSAQSDPKWDFSSWGNNNDWTNADNTNLGLAATLLSDALKGTVTASNMTANAGVNTVTNTQLDLSATSVANNHSITINADSPDNAMLVADLTQFAFANNTANAYVGNYSISNYSNLGKLTAPLLNVSAVAAGNVSNITINVNP